MFELNYNHYTPVFNREFSKPTFIMICQYEKVVGHYCDRQPWFNEFRTHSHQYTLNSQYNFAFSHEKIDMHEQLMEQMGLTNNDLPTIRAVSPKEPYHHFKYDLPIVDISYNSLLNFAFGVSSGGATTMKMKGPIMPK